MSYFNAKIHQIVCREKGREGRGRAGMGEGRGRVGPPKLKLGPQNYFPGAGAVESAYVD